MLKKPKIGDAISVSLSGFDNGAMGVCCLFGMVIDSTEKAVLVQAQGGYAGYRYVWLPKKALTKARRLQNTDIRPDEPSQNVAVEALDIRVST